MSRKTFIFFIVFLLVMLGLAAWYLFFRTPSGPTIPEPGTDPNLFPFGQGGVSTTTGPTGSTGGTGTTSIIDLTGDNAPAGSLPRLRRLWAEPVAGAAFVLTTASSTASSTTSSVRFVERATGHIHDSLIERVSDVRLSNVTIPQISEALISPNGRDMILRYLKDDASIQSFYARISTTTAIMASSTPIEGYFLPQNIRDIALKGTNILYFDPSTNGGNLIQSNIDGTRRVSVLNSDLKDWSLSWNSPGKVFLATRPSGTVGGFGYILDIAKGTLDKIVDEALGLSGTMSPRGDYVFVSGQDATSIASASYDVSADSLKILSLKTLSDKCAWSSVNKAAIYCAVPASIPQGTYPDDWYQGITTWNDRLWKIDMNTGETDLLLDPNFEVLLNMDMTNLSVSPDDSYLLFTNKKDMSLWLYRIPTSL